MFSPHPCLFENRSLRHSLHNCTLVLYLITSHNINTRKPKYSVQTSWNAVRKKKKTKTKTKPTITTFTFPYWEYVLTGTYINTYLMFFRELLSVIWCDTCIFLPFFQDRLDLNEVEHSGEGQTYCISVWVRSYPMVYRTWSSYKNIYSLRICFS